MKRITQKRLDELRATVPHATVADIGDLTIDSKAEAAEDLGAYFHHFAAPKRDEMGKRIQGNPCWVCNEPLNQNFEWGLVHGHGFCRNCGWPATLYHFIKDRHGEDLATVRGILLQQHPDDIEIRKQDAA